MHPCIVSPDSGQCMKIWQLQHLKSGAMTAQSQISETIGPHTGKLAPLKQHRWSCPSSYLSGTFMTAEPSQYTQGMSARLSFG